MPIDRTEKLKNILELLKADTVSPSDIEKFLGLLVNAVKQAKSNFDTLSTENIQKIEDFLTQIKTQHNQVLSEVTDKNSTLEGTFNAKIATVEALLNEVKAIEVKDGIDGIDGKNPDPSEVVPLVLKEIKFPEPFVLEGEQIVEKINDLEIEPDKQIDAVHIKNLPKEVQKHTVGFVRNTAYFDDGDILVIDNPTRIKFAGAGVSLAIDATGMLIATISGGAAANEVDEVATDSGDHTTFTILHTPNTGTLLVYNENTGAIYSPANYNQTTTSITFNSSLAVDGETPVVRAKYAF